MTKGVIIWLRIVAFTSILMAVLGVCYTLSYFIALYSEPFDTEAPYFREAYYTMVAICLSFYALLFFLGFQFWRLKTEYRFWFLGTVVAEIAYFFALGHLWRLDDERIALSIAAATGVANGGLVAQGVTLFPIWAALIVFWAHSNKLQARAD